LFFLVITLISAMAGFFTGLLGIGGGIIIIPSFLYILPLFGFEPISVNEITGISAVQVAIGSLSAFRSHNKNGLMDKKILLITGIFAGTGAITGAVLSGYLSDKILLIVYLLILLISAISLAFFKISEVESSNDKNKKYVNFTIFFSSIMSGAVGVGGAVLYLPILRFFYNIPTKFCIANVTYIVFAASIMTFTGKALTGQVPYHLIIYAVIGAYAGAKAGAAVSKKLSSSILKKILLLLIVITAVRVIFSLFS
jgi:uncharacterized membrane protein YfcA